MVTESTAKTTNLEKLSTWTNRLKSRILFSCKSFMFSDFTWKKNSAPGNGGGWRLRNSETID